MLLILGILFTWNSFMMLGVLCIINIAHRCALFYSGCLIFTWCVWITIKDGPCNCSVLISQQWKFFNIFKDLIYLCSHLIGRRMSQGVFAILLIPRVADCIADNFPTRVLHLQTHVPSFCLYINDLNSAKPEISG